MLPLNDLRDAFVIFGNSGHDRFGFGVLHLVSKSAYLLRSKSPMAIGGNGNGSNRFGCGMAFSFAMTGGSAICLSVTDACRQSLSR